MLLLCAFAAESLVMEFLLELRHSGLLSHHNLRTGLMLLLLALQLNPEEKTKFFVSLHI